MRYLIYFDATLGNFTHLIPYLYELKKNKTKFYLFIKNPAVLELIKIYKISNKVIYYSKKKKIFQFFNFTNLLRDINKINFEHVISLSLHNNWKNKLLYFYLKMKKKKIFKFTKKIKNKKYSNHVVYDDIKSESLNYKSLLEKTLNIKINVQNTKKKKKTTNIIGFHAGCSDSLGHKRWCKKKFEHLIKILLEKKFKIYLFGKGKQEIEINNDIISNLNNNKKIVNFTNKLNIKELIEKLLECDSVVANDSGVMQLSNFLGNKTISIFGPSSEVKNRPLNKHFIPLRSFSNKICNKYTNEICFDCKKKINGKKKIKCLDRVSVNYVYKYILK